MKKSYSPTTILLAVIWILIAAVGGCGWREVDRGERINFNWDRNILEVKTEEISSDSIEDKQLEIMFTKQTGDVVLKIWNFSLKKSVNNRPEDEKDEIFFNITFHEDNRLVWTRKPPGELRWIFKKEDFLNCLVVELAGTDTAQERIPITDEDKTEMFQFGSGDNISLSYRVNSTNENCVEPGSTRYNHFMIQES